MAKRTLSIEIDNFFELVKTQTEEIKCTTSGFSQSRYKMQHNFFIDWNKELIKEYYKSKKSIKRWRGFRLIGIDGSTMYLFDKQEIREYFGTHSNGISEVPMARVMNSYDLLNKMNLFSSISPIKIGENIIAQECIKHYDNDMLSIYDRGFGNFTMMYLHCQEEKEFVFRLKKGLNKIVENFVLSGEKSKIVEFKASKVSIKRLTELGYKVNENTCIKVRLVRVELESGEIEILATSLMDENKYPTKIFKKLYSMRWGVETEYGILKNIQQIEIFSGHKVEAIKQDFYAMIFTSNLHSLVIEECEEDVKEINKRRMYDYKINRNISLGLLKDELVLLFITSEPEKILLKLKKKFIKELVPIRPDRKYERKTKSKRRRGKYQTHLNYRRAI